MHNVWGACVYIMLPQQRKYEDKDEIVSEVKPIRE